MHSYLKKMNSLMRKLPWLSILAISNIVFLAAIIFLGRALWDVRHAPVSVIDALKEEDLKKYIIGRSFRKTNPSSGYDSREEIYFANGVWWGVGGYGGYMPRQADYSIQNNMLCLQTGSCVRIWRSYGGQLYEQYQTGEAVSRLWPIWAIRGK